MPLPEVHERIDKIVFGIAFPDVHKWIDGAFNGTNGRTHWIYRHHEEAINKRYPDCGASHRLRREVARLHVMVDWMWYHHIIFFPKNHQEVINELRKHGIVC